MLFPKIAMAGCGWLGLPLALKLKDKGHHVVATRRTKEGKDELDKIGLCGLQFNLGSTSETEAFTSFFDANVLIINIPPGRKTLNPEKFIQDMTNLLEIALQRGLNKLIFISTTSVYGDNFYQDKVTKVTEEYSVQPSTASAKAHVTIEQFIRQKFASDATIIRLAGLVGKNRHPAKFLAGRTDINHPNQIVNLIHQTDVVRAIEQVIELEVWGKTLHLASTEHPTRKDYYTWAAQRLRLKEPVFLPCSAAQTGKQIDATWSLSTLHLKLRYPSPFVMLD